MYTNFDSNTTEIIVAATPDNIKVTLAGDFAIKSHNSQLFVNENILMTELESVWRNVKDKSNKIIDIQLHFEEIDQLTTATNKYTTPVISMKKGQRMPHKTTQEHKAIPVDWAIVITATFEPCNRILPIIEFIEHVLGPYFTPAMSSEFEVGIRPLLQGEYSKEINFLISE